mmetsp:Transcript_117603/g.333279  ORF Transcript_117603/g.333279 Transcript_117603/m.333279 type:complete len:435 (+) Transcript_117603:52-1356(+)
MPTATEHIRLAEDAYEAASEKHGDNVVEMLKACTQVGVAHCNAGSMRQALIYLEKVFVYVGKGAEAGAEVDAGTVGQALEALGHVYALLEDAEKERKVWESLLAFQEQSGNPEAPAMCLVSFADHCGRQADTKQRAALLGRARSLLGEQAGRLAQLVQLRASSAHVTKLNMLSPGKQPSGDDAVARFFGMLLLVNNTDSVVGRRTAEQELEVVDTLQALRQELSDKSTGDAQKVELLLRRAEEKHGGASLQAAQWLALLAEVHGSKGDFGAKREALKRVLRIQEQEFGHDSIYVIPTLKGLAHVEGALGNLGARWELLRRSLDIQEEELGSMHTSTATTRYFLEAAIAEKKAAEGGRGGRTLPGLFGQRPPTNPKVNRFVREIVYYDSKCVDSPEDEEQEAAAPFEFSCTGGGSCVLPEPGIEIPFYFHVPPAA